jgi:hypothetical protein
MHGVAVRTRREALRLCSINTQLITGQVVLIRPASRDELTGGRPRLGDRGDVSHSIDARPGEPAGGEPLNGGVNDCGAGDFCVLLAPAFDIQRIAILQLPTVSISATDSLQARRQNAALDRYLDAWNEHDLDAVMSWHTDNTVFFRHVGGMSYSGHEAVRDAFRADLGTWPDVHWQPIRRFVTPQLWVLESTLTATTTAPVEAFGLAVAKGAVIRGRCVDLLTIDSGRIARKDTYLDVIDLFASSGQTV